MGALKLPPEEIPTADQVAVAVIAAAKVLGENPLDLGNPGVLFRARWPAMSALMVFYAAIPASRWGVMLGADNSAASRLRAAQDKPWWAELGAAAVNAACEALEDA